MQYHATPCHATPRHATPRHTTPRHATPRHAMPCHDTSRHATPRHAMPCHVMAMPCTPCYALLHATTYMHYIHALHTTTCYALHAMHAMPCHAMLICYVHAMPYKATPTPWPRHVLQCHTAPTPCHSMSRHAVPHYVMKCHALSLLVFSESDFQLQRAEIESKQYDTLKLKKNIALAHLVSISQDSFIRNYSVELVYNVLIKTSLRVF